MTENNGLEKWMKDGSNVMVYNAPPAVIESVQFGESKGIAEYCQLNKGKIEAVFWNEEFMSIRTRTGEIVRFEPELNEEVQVFFQRKTNYRDRSTGYVVWDGDYEKAKFTKKALLEFLSRHADELEEGVRKSIQDMRVTERVDTQSISLGDVERTVEEEEQKTSIPRNFKASIKIAENWYAEMHFKAYVAKNMDDYGRPQKGHSIILELENARQIKRDLMEFVLNQIPDVIPRYYGKLKALNVRRGEEL